MKKRSAALALTLTGFYAADADASGYLTARFGGDEGSPVQGNAYAVYFNPAALSLTKRTTVTGDASIALRFASYERTKDALSPSTPQALTDPAYVKANTGKATLFNVLVLPFVGVVSDFGTSSFRAGFASYVPFGGLASWDRSAADPASPGAQDGPQRWQNISGQLIANYNTLAASYTFPPFLGSGRGSDLTLAVGGSVSGIVHLLSTVRARNSDGSDDTVSPTGSLIEGRSLVKATGFDIGIAAGVLLAQKDGRYRLGLSYTSQPGFGTTRLSGTLATQFGSTAPATPEKVDFLQAYPDVVRLGSAVRVSRRFEARVDGEYVRWSVLANQCVVHSGGKCDVDAKGRDLTATPGQAGSVILNIPRNWRDALGLRAGFGYELTEAAALFGSLGVTTPAVPVSTIDAATIDALRLYASIGARYTMPSGFSLAGSYNHIAFLPVDTAGQSRSNTFDPISRTPSGNGVYSSQIGFFNVNASYTF